MRTNIVLDDGLVSEALKYAKNTHTKRDLIEVARREFVATRMRELKGNYGPLILSWSTHSEPATQIKENDARVTLKAFRYR